MAPEDIKQVRRTWARLVLERKVFGLMFYKRLFELAPETRVLFSPSLDVQGEKLFITLNWIVDNLSDDGKVFAAAEDLAIRHLAYGVEAKDYPAVGIALVDTLEEGLDGSITQAEKDAWANIYGELADAMIAAAYPETSTSGRPTIRRF